MDSAGKDHRGGKRGKRKGGRGRGRGQKRSGEDREGGGKRGKWNNKSDEQRSADIAKWRSGEGSWKSVEAKNDKFESFYKAQQIMPESEFDEFLFTFSRPLPTTFRLSMISGVHRTLLQRLRGECFGLSGKTIDIDERIIKREKAQKTENEQLKTESTAPTTADDEKKTDDMAIEGTASSASSEHRSADSSDRFGSRHISVPPPSQLSWYPDGLGWHLGISKADLRKYPILTEFRKFLINETDQGNVTRQEAVSMLPPLLLDVEAHHRVLDMCAAPGSKTAQLLEGLYRQVSIEADTNPSAAKNIPTGMVIANDADPRRAYMLVHQIKRLGSPNFLVTTHEGQFFPTLYKTVGDKTEPIFFDRILCDVPCSGDGTIRKNVTIWKKWTVNSGYALHQLQLLIARRAFQMLTVGGLMVYSTCSLNPMEDEAVVAELLRRCGGCLELVDVSDRLPGLIRSPGLSDWKVIDDAGKHWPSYSDELKEKKSKIRKSFFPPTAEEASQMHLERSFRILPHKQDTGGFFVALLRKTGIPKIDKVNSNNAAAPTTNDSSSSSSSTSSSSSCAGSIEELATGLSAEEIAEANEAAELAKDAAVNDDDEEKNTTPPKDKNATDDPFTPITHDVWNDISSFYGMPSDMSSSQFWSRGGKRAYFVSRGIAEILSCQKNDRLKVVHGGSRVVEKNPSKGKTEIACEWRISQEGIEVMHPFLSKQIIIAPKKEFLAMLHNNQMFFDQFEKDGQFVKDLLALKAGCCLVVLDPSISRELSHRPIILSSWLTARSLALMVNKVEKTALIALLNGENPSVNDDQSSSSKAAEGEVASVDS